MDCDSVFNSDEGCPICDSTKDDKEISHGIKMEDTSVNKDSRSPIYDTERTLQLERKIKEVSMKLDKIEDQQLERNIKEVSVELKKIDDYHIDRLSHIEDYISSLDKAVVNIKKENVNEDRVNHLEDCIRSLDKAVVNIKKETVNEDRVNHLEDCISSLDKVVVKIKKENVKEELNLVKEDLQNHLNRAHKVDQDVMKLQEKAENNMELKFKNLKAEVHKEFENQVDVIHTNNKEINEIRKSANEIISERNDTKTEITNLKDAIYDIQELITNKED